MDAYIYNAALLCEECASEVRCEIPVPSYDQPWDSDDYPHGPHSNGGGEADYPQHCDSCQLFLENPLTSDGEAYVLEADLETEKRGFVVDEWLAFYGLQQPEQE